jgi:hypothetical protein
LQFFSDESSSLGREGLEKLVSSTLSVDHGHKKPVSQHAAATPLRNVIEGDLIDARHFEGPIARPWDRTVSNSELPTVYFDGSPV